MLLPVFILFFCSYLVYRSHVVWEGFSFSLCHSVRQVVGKGRNFPLQLQISVRSTVPVLSIQASRVSGIQVRCLTMLLMRDGPLNRRFPNLFHIVRTKAAVTDLRANARRIARPYLVVERIFIRQFGDNDHSAAIVLNRKGRRGTRTKHFLPNAVMSVLPFSGFLMKP